VVADANDRRCGRVAAELPDSNRIGPPASCLFGKVLIPTAVIDELRNPMAPPMVSSWVSRLPSWIEIRTAATPPDASLGILDLGEREAILLAQETHADLF
jgi:predicted nucleic acid-binding protein